MKLLAKRIVEPIIGPVYVNKLKLQLLFNKIDKNEFYDSLTYIVMKQSLREDSICVDIGCHTGSILQMMMRHAPKGKFYAFEPLPDLYEKLTKTFSNNNVKIFAIALSNKKGDAAFNHVVSNPGYSGFIRRRYARPHEEDTQIAVRTDLLDNIIDKKEQISFIKADVEGAELQVFQGSVNTIKRDKPIIVFEHGMGAADIYGTRPEEVYDLFCEQCGMEVSLIDDWLCNRNPLSKQEFHDQFYKCLNYYFIAHPKRRRSNGLQSTAVPLRSMAGAEAGR